MFILTFFWFYDAFHNAIFLIISHNENSHRSNVFKNHNQITAGFSLQFDGHYRAIGIK